MRWRWWGACGMGGSATWRGSWQAALTSQPSCPLELLPQAYRSPVQVAARLRQRDQRGQLSSDDLLRRATSCKCQCQAAEQEDAVPVLLASSNCSGCLWNAQCSTASKGGSFFAVPALGGRQ